MKLAAGTPVWISLPLALALPFYLGAFLLDGFLVAGLIAASFLLFFFLFFIYFFRDPEREAAEGLVCPADGIVTLVEPGPPFRVSIFINVHNVHVNRMPMTGRVVSVEHIPGGYVPAFDKDSDGNERVVITVETGAGTMKLTQIAGILARRIVPYVKVGDTVERGERFGMIRLGSRVDLELDIPLVPKVKKGDRVYAGTTSLAEIP